MIQYTVIFEPGESNWPAHDPDLPGLRRRERHP
jgi:hypothetical protein